MQRLDLKYTKKEDLLKKGLYQAVKHGGQRLSASQLSNLLLIDSDLSQVHLSVPWFPHF